MQNVSMSHNNKSIIAIIPARGGSKSIPKKNITDFLGKPLLVWSIEAAKNSKFVQGVYVSTDDKEIAAVAEAYGAKVVWRPQEIAGDLSPSEEALQHAIGEIEKTGQEQIDYVVFLQATSPLRETKDVDNAVEKIMAEGADSLFSGAAIGDFFIWRKLGDMLESVNYDYKNRKRRQDFGEQFVENGSLYVFKPSILAEHNNRLGGKIVVSEMEFYKSFEIDDAEDLEFCEALARIKGFDNK